MSTQKTDLHAAACDYLKVRRALGFILAGHDRLLESFISFLESTGTAEITVERAVAWSVLPPKAQPARYAQRLCVVRGFARYLSATDPAVPVPPTRLLSGRREYQMPYLYSASEIASIMDAANDLKPPFWAATCNTLFGLLAVSGMRIGEVIGMDDEDVDLRSGLLTVRATKSRRQRQLPLDTSTVVALAAYVDLRRALLGTNPDTAFFTSTAGNRLKYPAVHDTFVTLLKRAGIEAMPGRRGPRIHGLRHRFAVDTLHGWSQQGADIQVMLPVLSAYLGHTQPSSTYWYLHASAEVLSVAVLRLEEREGQTP